MIGIILFAQVHAFKKRCIWNAQAWANWKQIVWSQLSFGQARCRLHNSCLILGKRFKRCMEDAQVWADVLQITWMMPGLGRVFLGPYGACPSLGKCDHGHLLGKWSSRMEWKQHFERTPSKEALSSYCFEEDRSKNVSPWADLEPLWEETRILNENQGLLVGNINAYKYESGPLLGELNDDQSESRKPVWKANDDQSGSR